MIDGCKNLKLCLAKFPVARAGIVPQKYTQLHNIECDGSNRKYQFILHYNIIRSPLYHKKLWDKKEPKVDYSYV